MKRTLAFMLVFVYVILLLPGSVFAISKDDVPEYYTNLMPYHYEPKVYSVYHSPGFVIEVDITTHIIYRKFDADGYTARLCTPNGIVVTYDEVQLLFDPEYVPTKPSQREESTPFHTHSTQPSEPTTMPTPSINNIITKASVLGDVSRGNHPLAELGGTKIIVPRPLNSKYESISMLETSEINLSDIEGHWANEYITKFTKNGFISGYPDGTFKPDNPVTYGEFATIVARMNLRPVSWSGGYEAFAELKNISDGSAKWFYDAVMISSEAGVFGREVDRPFRQLKGNQEATRQFISLAMANMLVYEVAPSSGFSDCAQLSNATVMAIDRLYVAEIIKGYPDGGFRPDAAITRAELVTMLTRLLNKYEWDMGVIHDNLYGNYNLSNWQEEVKLLDLVNAERAKVGTASLTYDPNIRALAQIKSIDMEINDYFEHTSPTFGSPFDMAKSFGYSANGENILYSSTQVNAESAHESWTKSQGHRENYMNKSHKTFGAAIGRTKSVEIFGR